MSDKQAGNLSNKAVCGSIKPLSQTWTNIRQFWSLSEYWVNTFVIL